MRKMNGLVVVLLLGLTIACEKVSENAVELTVDFSWDGMKECGWGNPEIHFSGVPESTKFIQVKMYDHVYVMDHGKVQVPYNGDAGFEMGRFEKIQGPCPTSDPGRYEITVRALDENEVVIGEGRKERYFPENT